MAPDSRLAPCYLLRESGIPCVVWFEDALAYHGVPTALFGLYVLVPDIEAATQSLAQQGWTEDMQHQPKVGNAYITGSQRCLIPPQQESLLGSALSDPSEALGTEPERPEPPPPPRKGPTKTLLLPASEWNYSLPDYPAAHCMLSEEAFIPPLPALVDALIDSLLDDPLGNFSLQGHLACQVAYLYGHVSQLQDPTFKQFLKEDHRQFHLDSLSDMSTGTVPFILHERSIRDAIRNGAWELRECSATRDREDLFSKEYEAKLLASLPQPDFGDIEGSISELPGGEYRSETDSECEDTPFDVPEHKCGPQS